MGSANIQKTIKTVALIPFAGPVISYFIIQFNIHSIHNFSQKRINIMILVVALLNGFLNIMRIQLLTQVELHILTNLIFSILAYVIYSGGFLISIKDVVFLTS
jgi:hypothetical protein